MLLHPEARLESLAAGGRVLTAQEAVNAIEAATKGRLYLVKAWYPRAIGPKAGLAVARVRYRVGPTGFTDERRVWIATEQHGLIWRMRIFHTPREAITCLRDNGLTLGL